MKVFMTGLGGTRRFSSWRSIFRKEASIVKAAEGELAGSIAGNDTMNPGIEGIVGMYVKLGELDTLQRMKEHRQGLLDQCVDTANFSFDVTRSIYRSDLEVIEAGIESLYGEITGHVDVVNEKRIAGWALYNQHPDKRVAIDIYFNGNLVGEVVADEFRNDLLKLNEGDGHHAFVFVPPSGSYQPPLQIEVRAAKRKVLKAVTVEQPVAAVEPETAVEPEMDAEAK
ncbi:hypothetical protein [Bradyrhizobium brasilense]|uniref:Uncharacterized protein n=1 Tax=Bradyrhizobium brasilense TaxID=1419277 RepID=A0A1G7Q5N2_9BRAD|nr:hypothetical protein [Bradyrhizobium brasilense]MCC8973036.1 hypothetical protein [Bradyrhizobium brasilense]SDF93783.1 hypothetical protein SAMN05216337_10919 [Bradyrhizobium brasilense]